jgi:hypothetical protein
MERGLTFKRTAEPLAKSSLVAGAYYVGICRSARVARWDGAMFHHWRLKFGAQFVETIKHRDDDETFDVFDAWARVENVHEVREIPIATATETV